MDLYIGGSEHATGHLLYARFWVKFMKDRGFVGVEEPFKKLINQGMILGTSAFVYRLQLENHSDYLPNVLSGRSFSPAQRRRIDSFIEIYNNKIFASYDLIKDHPFKDLIPEENKGTFNNIYA